MESDVIVSVLLVVGGAFALIGSIGLARLPDIFMRLHGPTKATTLGLGGILCASGIHFSWLERGISLHEVLITFFLFVTAPVSAHMLSKAALYLRVPHRSAGAPPDDTMSPDDKPLSDPQAP